MNKQVDQIFRLLSEQNPNPTTELESTNNYTLLVAVVLSAQATDVGVNKATRELFKLVKTPQQMVELGGVGLKNYIKTIGLYNSKAKNIIALSKKLIAEFNSEVPSSYEALKSLPGVGRKTANVILNTAFGEHTIAVDTHVFRVSNRIGLARSKTPEGTEAQLMKNIPDKWKRNAHHWLILHGRYTCKARKPDCNNCIIKGLCSFFKKRALTHQLQF
jgi:endonuclease III